MAQQYRVLLSRRAAATLRRLPPNRRGRLTLILASIAARSPAPGLRAVRSWFHIAACEVLPQRGVVLVYAVLERSALRDELLGEELTEELQARDGARFMHGRS